MSQESPQAEGARRVHDWNQELAVTLSRIALPNLEQYLGSADKQGMLSGMLATRDASGRLPGSAGVLRDATSELERGYQQAGFNAREGLNYAGLRTGEGRLSPGAMTGAWQGMATSLDRDRTQALANLNFMSANQSMTDYNRLLGLMGQGTQTAMGLATGSGGAAASALGGMNPQSQFGSALGGAATGAGMGATFGPYGALIGGVAGLGAGLIGYRG